MLWIRRIGCSNLPHNAVAVNPFPRGFAPSDDEAERDGDLRVVDESGEDYLFAADRFVAIEVPTAVRASLLKASRA
jgi:hypothetical protein